MQVCRQSLDAMTEDEKQDRAVAFSLAQQYSGFTNSAYDLDDFIQEAWLATTEARKSFCASKDHKSLVSWQWFCGRRRLLSFIKHIQRQEHRRNSKAVPPISLNSISFEGDEDSLGYILQDSSPGPETVVVETETMKSIRAWSRSSLTATELAVLEAWEKYKKAEMPGIKSGNFYAVISQELDLTKRSIDNALQRVRRKARASEYLKELCSISCD